MEEFLSLFLDKSNNKNQALIQSLAVSDQLAKLTHGITLLEKELQQQVLQNHDQLVSQATWVDKLESILADLQSHVQRLLSSVERLRGKVVEPFNKLETQTMMLARLHATSDLLRRTSRIQQLTKRLPNTEAMKASVLISELDELCRDVDLSGLQILEDDQRLIRTETLRIEKEAQQMLTQGLHSLNQTQVSNAIQIFRNLGCLEQETSLIMERSLSKIQHSAEKALDIENLNPTERSNKSKGGPGRATGSMYPGNITNFRNTLWAAWENVLYSVVFPQAKQMAVLQSVLIKKMSSVPVLSIGDAQPHDDNKSDIASVFWAQANELLTKQLSKAAESSSFIKQALEGEYPKLLRLHLDLHKQLQAEPLTSNVYPDAGKCGHQFETAYLSRSVARLLDSVHSMFSGEAPPSTEDVDSLIRTITNELSVSLVEEALSLTVARNIGKAVRLFCLKGEQMLVVSGEASQVIEPPTAGQILNVNIGNIAYYLTTQVRRVSTNMSANLPKPAVTELNKALGNADHLTKLIINPLIGSINDAIESIILTIHQEDFNMEETPTGSSLYMKELVAFISRAASSYLAPYHHQQVITQNCLDVAIRCIELFLRHACLVRPMSIAGRVKLAADFKQLEVAISPLCKQLSELGRSYRLLRSFRPLIEAAPQEVADCSLLGDLIPYSLALMSLFSRAPSELPSPHQSANWSIARLSQWLDSHKNEKERLELLSGALQKYQQRVRQQNQTNFHPVYPILMDVLKKGFESIAASQST
ncbi:conserved oligomeric Golgi complex subunit 5 four way stop isoform X2 [Lycorma delicatula]|uniref:conserved oligomeric Golgi complex subunit 5 four way stop isoform X2 n=1 Tax=Lycorma delicatula TaxID=130591 RepID=UPI003F50FB30